MRKRTIAAFVVAGALALGCSPDGEVTDTAAGTGASEAESTEVEAKKSHPKLHQPARDGKFEFMISKVECGKTTLGKAPFTEKAQGMFCLVTLTVKNVQDEPQTMFADNQYAYAGETKYSPASSAVLFLDDSNDVLWEEINPGNKAKGTIVYDVPKGTKITHFELHDSMFSGGVTVLNAP